MFVCICMCVCILDWFFCNILQQNTHIYVNVCVNTFFPHSLIFFFFFIALFSYRENTCSQFCFTSQQMNPQKQKAPWRTYTLKQENL